jgi:hypothetical protein
MSLFFWYGLRDKVKAGGRVPTLDRRDQVVLGGPVVARGCQAIEGWPELRVGPFQDRCGNWGVVRTSDGERHVVDFGPLEPIVFDRDGSGLPGLLIDGLLLRGITN